jgi:uncharacterized protein YraI
MAGDAHMVRQSWAGRRLPLIPALIIMLAQGSMAATITVHDADPNGRVFVDVVGRINLDDADIFETKTANFRRVIVTLVSPGGNPLSAIRIGETIRKNAMTTFVPGDRECASACALIWLAGKPRTIGINQQIGQIGFHAAYDVTTGQEKGAANAVIGAYLNNLGLGYKAIFDMTERGPTEKMRYLTADLAKEWGVTWEVLQPPRTIPNPPQPELQISPRMLPSVRARTRAVVHTLLGIGLPMKVGLLFSPTIIVIPENATVNIEDRCQSRVGWAPWCLVSYQGKQGYVNGIYLRMVTERPPPRPEAKRARTRTDLNLRMAPDPRSSILREMPKDSDVIVGECRRIDDGETWCRVLHDGALGWANRFYFDDMARTRTDLNLRIAPNHRSTVLREMPEGSDVIVTGECRRSADGENWCRVTYDGISGWANASFLE